MVTTLHVCTTDTQLV